VQFQHFNLHQFSSSVNVQNLFVLINGVSRLFFSSLVVYIEALASLAGVRDAGDDCVLFVRQRGGAD
jgi:hypothetical protein